MDAPQPNFHEKFNFDDGNIIVSASGPRDGEPSSTVETVHFQLHKSILEIYGTTFADVLSTPQGDGALEHAVIHLQDPLDHVIKLLTAVYYGCRVPEGPLSRAKWDFLVPVLVLADKYDMGRVTENLLPKLLEDWPTTLEKWDDVDARTRSIARATADRRLEDPSLPSPDDILPEPTMVAKFGQTHPAARNILPAAFYYLSRLSYSTPEDPGLFYYSGQEVLRSADCTLLTSADWVRVVRGQANIRGWLYDRATQTFSPRPCPRHEHRKTEDIDDEEDNDNGTPSPCGRVCWWNTRIKPLILAIGTKRAVDVLGGLKGIRDTVEKLDRQVTPEDELCHYCQHTLIKELNDSRRRFWARLPSFFYLGDYPNWGSDGLESLTS